MLPRAEFGEMFRSFRRTAFRVELLPEYRVPQEVEGLATYLGDQPMPDWVAADTDWRESIRAATAGGRLFSRVHVVRGPLTPYLRYECEWGYAFNAAAGDRINILDLSEANYSGPIPEYDYWMFDDATCVRMHYAEGGSFLDPELVDSAQLGRLRDYRDALLAASVPFTEYWSAHPEYHRGF